jgi:hypothetical protein
MQKGQSFLCKEDHAKRTVLFMQKGQSFSQLYAKRTVLFAALLLDSMQRGQSFLQHHAKRTVLFAALLLDSMQKGQSFSQPYFLTLLSCLICKEHAKRTVLFAALLLNSTLLSDMQRVCKKDSPFRSLTS